METVKERVPSYFSQKIRVLSFFTMIAVVYIHAYNYADTFLQPMTRIKEGMHIPAMIEFFFANALTRFAVPTFFLISGYLFFAGLQKFTAADYIGKIKSRIISLVVPYAFWVPFWSFIGLLMINLFSDANFPILQEKFADWADSPFRCMYNLPLPFQFWFLKDLMKLVLLSPLFYLLVTKLKEYSLLLFIIPWLLDISFPVVPNVDGMLFFAAGTYIALCGKDRMHIERPVRNKTALLFPIIWVLACAGYTLLCASPSAACVPDMFLTIAHKICMALGVASVFILYDFLPKKESKKQSPILASTFVIFALHEPLQHFVFQYVFLQERSDALHLVLYFSLPLLFVLFGILVSILLSRFAPKLRSFLTGGR